MISKNLYPDLFTRDYAFGNRSHFDFYIPLYLQLNGWLTSYTQEYAQTLVILMPFVMLIYLISMYILLLYVSGSAAIAIVVTLISSTVWPALGSEVWGVASLQVIIPRTLFTALAPGLFGLMLKWGKHGCWWQWGLLSLSVGLAANLHPVSGIALAELLLSLIILLNGISLKTLVTLLLSIIAIGLGAWPTAINFFQATGSEYGAVSFVDFSQVLRERIAAVFSSELGAPALFGYQVSVVDKQILAWIYVAAMVGWGVVFLANHLGRMQLRYQPGLYLALFLIQVPVVFLLTAFQAGLIVVATLYWIAKSHRNALDRVDFFGLVFLTLTSAYSFLGSFFVDLIWTRFEIWPLTPLVMQQMRGGRFVYLPLFVFVACFLKLFVHQQPSRRKTFQALALVSLLSVAPHSIHWATLAGLLILVELYGGDYVKSRWWSQLIFDIVVRTWIIRAILLMFLQTTQQWSILAFVLAVSYSLFNIWRERGENNSFPTSARLAISLAPFMILWVFLPGKSLSSWAIDLVSVPISIWARVSPSLLGQRSPERQDQLELYDWARTTTDINSLFYYDSLEFRLLAQRSLTHSSKDIGAGSYQGAKLVEFDRRYKKLQSAYEDPRLLLEYAHHYDVDYIITTRQQALALPLPITFQNATFLVYHLE
jgi:hypothetical protein